LLKAIALKKLSNFPEHVSTLYVQQELIGEADTALHLVMHADPRVQDLKRQERQLLKQNDGSVEITSQLDEVYRQLSILNAGTAESRAIEILKGLDFTKKMYSEPTTNLSGGTIAL
jgi:ATP-binding cassette subfamily F protein 2